jgi:hypothetical protein
MTKPESCAFPFCSEPTLCVTCRIAFSIMILKAALVFWGRDPEAPLAAETDFDKHYPPTPGESKLVSRWHQFPLEEREVALQRALTHFVGGTMKALLRQLEREPLPGSPEYERRISPIQRRAAEQVTEWMSAHGYD